MSKPPKIVIPGLNRGNGIAGGFIVGRLKGKGPAQLLGLNALRQAGLATAAGVVQSTSSTASTAASQTASLSTGVSSGLSTTNSTNVAQSTSLSQISSSLSGAISSTTSLSSAASTVVSGSISTVNSRIDSLSTAGGGADDDTALSSSLSSAVSINTTQSTSLSQISSSLSGAISSTSSLSTAVSTVDANQSTSISVNLSKINSLSTAVGGGGGGPDPGQSTSLSQISSSLSGAISSITSLSTAVSTVDSNQSTSISINLSKINSLSTAVGGGTVSLVQSLAVVGNTALNSITLGANPTAGNMLVMLGTHWASGPVAAAGWNTILNTNGVTTDGEICLWKLVNATDAASATIAPFTGGTAGQMGVVFEVSGALGITSGAFEHFKETSSASQTLNAVATKAGCLLVGYFGTVSSNTAPTSVTNVTAMTTVTGTATNASPRQVTGFYNSFGAAGSLASVCTYAGSHNQYGAAYVLLPA